MEVQTYRIRKIVPSNQKHGIDYAVTFELPNQKQGTLQLRQDHPSWKLVRRIDRSESPRIIIGAFNHEWLHLQTNLHEVRAVELPEHMEGTQVTVSFATENAVVSMHDNDGNGVDLYFHLPNQALSEEPHRLLFRDKNTGKNSIHFVDELECPELDLEIVPANPLQWGPEDFNILALRLPKRFETAFSP
ncbi:MAG: hypothetical protein AAB664_00735 [Patescibacteria group bacterium]